MAPLARIAIIGGGPAGLMAAEAAIAGNCHVDLYDAMPSPGRKFLLAGRGGLNLTHSEAAAQFLSRYGKHQQHLEPHLARFDADAVRAWAAGLGVDTFVGSSGRVFPKEMKAAPLLRAWLHRLRASGVRIHARHRWLGWDPDGTLRFQTAAAGEGSIRADATILALGGGSWARLGSDGTWVPTLTACGIPVAPLQPANCGFDVAWSEFMRTQHAGDPVKAISLSCTDIEGKHHNRRGEFVVTAHGIEGSAVYALSSALRERIARDGSATLTVDLCPERSHAELSSALARARGRDSLANHLRRRAGLSGVRAALLRESAPEALRADAAALAQAIKALPLHLSAPRPLDEAISSAGGVRFTALDTQLMLHDRPGVFCAGEMLDWEAPTGGYLLTACLATGRAAGSAAAAWVSQQ